jgi:archaeal preflagellin peptidase FlaK
MNLQEIFAAARVAVSLCFLIYASWSDYKTREVTDNVWLIYAPIAFALTLAELLLFESSQLWLFGVSVGITIGFALLLFFTGQFGGADSKAFMCIAVALPFFPAILVALPILPEGLSPISTLVFPLTILTNSVLLSASSALILLLSNIGRRIATHQPFFEGTLAKESAWKKLLVLLTAQKLPISTLKIKWHKFPLEDVEEDGDTPKRKLFVYPHVEETENAPILERLAKASENGKIGNKVWASPGLPLLIFVTAGLVVTIVFGDLVWILVTHLLG